VLTDHDVTEELAAAFHDHADPVTRTALDPAGIFRRGTRARRRRAAIRVAAAGAAATALAVVVTVANLGAGPAPGPTRGPGAAPRPPGLLLDAAVTGPLPAGAAALGMPRYYVTTDHSHPVAEVRASATGKLLATVALPRTIDPKTSQIAAAGNGRTFALALLSFPRTRFYRLQVAGGGRSARLTGLNAAPLPAGEYADGIAVSPDGSRLAVAIQRSGGQHGTVEVVSLATGATRTWTTAQAGIPAGVSWAGSHTLGFFWEGTGAAQGGSGLWTLDTAAPGNRLLSGRRVLPASTGGDAVQYAQLTAAGTVVAAVTYDGTAHVSRGTVVGGIVELSAGTGRPSRTLLLEHAAYSADPGQPGWYITPCLLAAADRTGSHLLVSCDRFGRLDRGRFTALPGAAPQSAVAAAW
jgi:hypothetical protein